MDELPEDDVDDGEGKCVPEDADICSDDEDTGVMASDSRIMRAYALVSVSYTHLTLPTKA